LNEQIKIAMEWLGNQPNTIFLGQTVKYDGSPMYKSLANVNTSKKIEMPVAEDMQMGISIGLALEGFIPISIYPRWDFLICATNQLVNHLDKIKEMSYGEFKAGAIIRTMYGNKKPLYPGIQHCQDYTNAFKKILKSTKIVRISNWSQVIPVYQKAYKDALKGISTIVVEKPQGVKNYSNK
jgi:pyruvate/2-oxoglutarate/acetoin dehydrogenase E1 component